MMNILIVDDDPASVQHTQGVLDKINAGRVVPCADPQTALDWCAANEPDVVLVVYPTPHLDGLEFIRRLRALPGGRDVSIGVVTSVDDAGIRLQTLEVGAGDFVRKPLDTPEGVARLRHLVSLAASRRARIDQAARLSREVDRATAELRQSEERYDLTARSANDGLWDWNLRTDEFYTSPHFKAMLGYAGDDLSGSSAGWFAQVHPDDQDKLRAAIQLHRDGSSDLLSCEFRARLRDGSYRWMLIRGMAACDETGHALRMAGSLTDVDDRKQTEHQLLHDAFHDPLTGLPNRALFMDRLGQALHRYRRRRAGSFAVAFMDIDRFTVINDTLGLAAGDELLAALARRVTVCLRPSDTMARLGGDVFTILFEDVATSSHAVAAINRIKNCLAEPFRIQGTETVCTASIGIALCDTSYQRAEDLLRDADVALHRAKANGQGAHEVFEAALHSGTVERLELETDLRNALRRGNELVLYYQPIIRLTDGTIAGFEALLRWQHPLRGMILPGEFIPLAEQAGLIEPIGDFVVAEAAKQLQVWKERLRGRTPYVAVNMSSRQFRDPAHIQGLVDRITAASAQQQLQLEITESVLMENAEQVVEMLKQIKAMGTRISIDDFGTGYSSLSYLHKFPVDILKIDRAFVALIVQWDSNVSIIRAIIRLGQELGMSVVAEGIETSTQCQALRDLGCEFGQGYYFSMPVAAGAATALIESSPSLQPGTLSWLATEPPSVAVTGHAERGPEPTSTDEPSPAAATPGGLSGTPPVAAIREPSPPNSPGAERRRFLRADCALQVAYEVVRPGVTLRGEGFLVAINASAGGIKIRMPHPLEVGWLLKLRLTLPDGPLQIRARIVWASPARQEGGLAFVDVPEADRQRVQVAIEQASGRTAAQQAAGAAGLTTDSAVAGGSSGVEASSEAEVGTDPQ